MNIHDRTEIVYPITLTLDTVDGTPDGFIITCRDIPELISHGDSYPEIISMAQSALSLALESYIENKRVVPKPSAFQHGDIAIALTVEDATKVQLHNLNYKNK